MGGVSLFGGADIFGDLNKSPDTGGNSLLETSMENKNEVCTMCVCVWGGGGCVGVGVEGKEEGVRKRPRMSNPKMSDPRMSNHKMSNAKMSKGVLIRTVP